MKIEMIEIGKTIKGRQVLDGINLSFETGKIYGLVGENGSGKTMLLRVLAGLIRPTKGCLKVDGRICTMMDLSSVKVGLILENVSLYPQLTGYENLRYLADISSDIGDNVIWDTMKSVGLDPFDSRKVSKYSLGMRQKLAISQAMMENPALLLLDEPTNGLDEESAEHIRKKIEQEKEDRITLLASHNKQDIEMLCDEVIHIAEGRIC
jgi:ABC-2 type transport system ATP-binding protein